MPENVEAWWARRQFSKGVDVPYPVGTYRSDWERYPTLIRQYHADLNHWVMLTQVPPAAEVYLTWQCEVGHLFVATPEEQRARPGHARRRSSWCPECAALAVARPIRRPSDAAPAADAAVEKPYSCGHPRDPRRIEVADDDRCYLCRRLDGAATTREHLLALVAPGRRNDLASETTTVAKYRWVCSRGHGTYESTIEKMLGGRRCRVCRHAAAAADRYDVGDAFVSPWAPKPSSAIEGDLRQRFAERFDVDLTPNAIRVAQPFFTHLEIWPDLVINELKVAIELDTIGRHGLEHVGRREAIDTRKDRLARSAGWEVIRIRLGKLQPLGPYDLCASGVTATLMDRVDDQLAALRGDLFVSAYRR